MFRVTRIELKNKSQIETGKGSYDRMAWVSNSQGAPAPSLNLSWRICLEPVGVALEHMRWSTPLNQYSD